MRSKQDSPVELAGTINDEASSSVCNFIEISGTLTLDVNEICVFISPLTTFPCLEFGVCVVLGTRILGSLLAYVDVLPFGSCLVLHMI